MRNKIAYHSPTEVAEVANLLREAKRDGVRAKILAGGTTLVPRLREGQEKADLLISLKRLSDISTISVEGSRLRIGTLVTIDQLVRSPLINKHAPVLGQAASLIGGPQIRNMATIGGNLCNAASYADLAGPSLILEASVQATSSDSQRRIPLDQFFTGAERTALRQDELATEISIDYRRASLPAIYDKLTIRRAMGIGIVSVAVALSRRKGVCEDVKIALSAVAPIPFRVRDAERVLTKRELSADLIDEAALVAADAFQPDDDLRASGWYRRNMARMMVRRVLLRLWKGQT